MHQAERRSAERIAQIVVEAADLRRQQQALVDHRARRRSSACRARVMPGSLCFSASAASGFCVCLRIGEQLALERVLIVADVRPPADDAWRITGISAMHGFAQPVEGRSAHRASRAGPGLHLR